jgi:hypothetical protein
MTSPCFLAHETTPVQIADLSKLSLCWAVSNACGYDVDVDIEEDYSCLTIIVDQGERYFSSDSPWLIPSMDMIGTPMIQVKVSIWSDDDITWHARCFSQPQTVFSAPTQVHAISMALVSHFYGSDISVPTQIHKFDELQAAARVAREQADLDAANDDAEDLLRLAGGEVRALGF